MSNSTLILKVASLAFAGAVMLFIFWLSKKENQWHVKRLEELKKKTYEELIGERKNIGTPLWWVKAVIVCTIFLPFAPLMLAFVYVLLLPSVLWKFIRSEKLFVEPEDLAAINIHSLGFWPFLYLYSQNPIGSVAEEAKKRSVPTPLLKVLGLVFVWPTLLWSFSMDVLDDPWGDDSIKSQGSIVFGLLMWVILFADIYFYIWTRR